METPADILFRMFPEIKNVPKMRKFIDKRYHIALERAEAKNLTNWFDTAESKGWLPAMIAHRNMTTGFKWNNFDNWIKNKENSKTS